MALPVVRGMSKFPRISKLHAVCGLLRNDQQIVVPHKSCSNSIETDKTLNSSKKIRILSGIQPTGMPHIGNYIGAINPWVKLQDKHGGIICCIVDLHSITVPQEPKQLRQNILDMAACLLACGIDPEKSILFQQSDVSEHTELAWILGCMTTLPRLQHLPQWKQKSAGVKDVGLGLFTYPVLQAADILLYKATDIPVGDDQVKHIELTRHLAKTFNNKYGKLFPEPNHIVGKFDRIKSLRNPANKMSKSDPDPKSRIELTDTRDVIREKFKKAVSDFTSTVSYQPKMRPAISNLIDIHSAFLDISPEEICKESSSLDTLRYKHKVADILVETLTPVRHEIFRLQKDPAYIKSVLSNGADKARAIAQETYEKVQQLVGFR